MGLLDRFRRGLKRTSDLLQTDIRDLFKQDGQLADDAFLDRLFALLVRTDMGVGPAQESATRSSSSSVAAWCNWTTCWHNVKQQLLLLMNQAEVPPQLRRIRPDRDPGRGCQRLGQDDFDRQTGADVPGSRLPRRARRGRHVRAAAVEQLTVWAHRIGAEIVTGAPAAIRPASPIERWPARWNWVRKSASSTRRAGCRPNRI